MNSKPEDVVQSLELAHISHLHFASHRAVVLLTINVLLTIQITDPNTFIGMKFVIYTHGIMQDVPVVD